MPLIKGKSDKSFVKNLKTEMHEGKSQPQSLAIAYSMKRKAEHKAQGGEMCAHGGKMHCNMGCYAEGGQVKDNYQSPSSAGHQTHENDAIGKYEMSGWTKDEWNKRHPPMSDMPAQSEDDRKLGQHGEEEQGPDSVNMSEGGQLTNSGYQDESHEKDMVGHIMAQRQVHYSQGGKVANKSEPSSEFKPNEFDDLALRDDLENHYTGANSGDELSDEQEDKDRNDMVTLIMKKRKPQHNPRPA